MFRRALTASVVSRREVQMAVTSTPSIASHAGLWA
jgi:hypothetical protein